MSERNLELSNERSERYEEKLEKLEELVSDIEDWHIGTESLLKDKPMRKAVYKSFQEAGEILSDVCAMYLSDSDLVLGDDSENIDKAAGKLFSTDIREQLLEVNGLRNRIVHDYNGFDDKVALESIQNRLENLRDFREEVSKWIEKN